MGYLREEKVGKGRKILIIILKKLTFVVLWWKFCNFKRKTAVNRKTTTSIIAF